MDTAITIIIAVLGSTALSALIQFFVSRHDKNHDRLADIERKLDTNIKDSVRLQLLFLITNRPDDEQQILKVGQHYFGDLHANWYATPIFNQWAEERHIKPEWFNNKEK